MLKLYAAQENQDLTEGRGVMRLIAIFAREADAILAAKGRGVMGHGDGEVSVVIVYETWEEFAAKDLERIRQNALAKLTPAEIRALGIGS